MSTKKVPVTHWIIINPKAGRIWKQPFLTLDQAQRELDAQVLRSGRPNKGWIIEERQTYVEVEDVAGKADGFGEF